MVTISVFLHLKKARSYNSQKPFAYSNKVNNTSLNRLVFNKDFFQFCIYIYLYHYLLLNILSCLSASKIFCFLCNYIHYKFSLEEKKTKSKEKKFKPLPKSTISPLCLIFFQNGISTITCLHLMRMQD